MNWNDAAEDLLNDILSRTPRPVRDQAETALRQLAEGIAEEEGKNRVGTNTVVTAWIKNTPEMLRAELPRQMEQLGLDPEEYEDLLGAV